MMAEQSRFWCTTVALLSAVILQPSYLHCHVVCDSLSVMNFAGQYYVTAVTEGLSLAALHDTE